ncbi:MAG TPA: ribbon-helix-helix domain-containing protein [Candidatus Dormibacteraeota bacterium]|jgi:metal-responsive CopG/Arc/MetJ family transcriptional regulator|nr:ribbon-helix-helix domain-containing protein [Candidatus Dormibacteraeota bacterium]
MPSVISVELGADLVAELEAKASEDGVPVSEVVRVAVAQFLTTSRKDAARERRARDAAGWRQRVSEHLTKKYAQKELYKDFPPDPPTWRRP